MDTKSKDYSFDELYQTFKKSVDLQAFLMQEGVKAAAIDFKKQYGTGLCYVKASGLNGITYGFIPGNSKLDQALINELPFLSNLEAKIMEEQCSGLEISRLMEMFKKKSTEALIFMGLSKTRSESIFKIFSNNSYYID